MSANNDWLYFDDVLRPYGSYRILNVGVSQVNPSDIVALSISVNDVLTSGKLQKLEKKIKENGWKDVSPVDLHLIKMPNSKYTVESGGNHRAYYSRMNGIKLIKAFVDVLIPYEMINPNILSNIEKLDDAYTLLAAENYKLTRKLKATGQNVSENDRYNELSTSMDKNRDEIQMLLKEEACRSGLLNT